MIDFSSVMECIFTSPMFSCQNFQKKDFEIYTMGQTYACRGGEKFLAPNFFARLNPREIFPNVRLLKIKKVN